VEEKVFKDEVTELSFEKDSVACEAISTAVTIKWEKEH